MQILIGSCVEGSELGKHKAIPKNPKNIGAITKIAEEFKVSATYIENCHKKYLDNESENERVKTYLLSDEEGFI